MIDTARTISALAWNCVKGYMGTDMDDASWKEMTAKSEQNLKNVQSEYGDAGRKLYSSIYHAYADYLGGQNGN